MCFLLRRLNYGFLSLVGLAEAQANKHASYSWLFFDEILMIS